MFSNCSIKADSFSKLTLKEIASEILAQKEQIYLIGIIG